MKIYEPKPLHLIRLTITKKDFETKSLNFIDTTQQDCIENVISIIEDLKISVFMGGNLTRMDFRDCIGGKNGKSKSISFKGLNPDDLYNLLIKKYKK